VTWTRLTRAFLGVSLGLALIGPAFAASSLTSDFDVSTEGWTHTGASVLQQVATGGNPGGYLFVDNSEGDITYLFAPAKYLGNLSAFDGGTVSFDGNMLGIGGAPYTAAGLDYGHLRLTGAGMSATLDLLPSPGQPLQNVWSTYTAALDAASWNKSQADWTTLLSNVTEVRLSVEAMFGNEVQGIDNFAISPVPEPRTWIMLAAGLALVAGVVRRRR